MAPYTKNKKGGCILPPCGKIRKLEVGACWLNLLASTSLMEYYGGQSSSENIRYISRIPCYEGQFGGGDKFLVHKKKI